MKESDILILLKMYLGMKIKECEIMHEHFSDEDSQYFHNLSAYANVLEYVRHLEKECKKGELV